MAVPLTAPAVPDTDTDTDGWGPGVRRHGRIHPGMTLEMFVEEFDVFCECVEECVCPWSGA